MQNVNSIIPNTDDRFVSFILKELFFGGSTGPVTRRSDGLWSLLILALILIIGTEPFKVLLRKNIGKLSISMGRLVLCFILYLLWCGVILLVIYEMRGDTTDYPWLFQLWLSPVMLWVSFVFILIFSFFMLITGIIKNTSATYKFNEDPAFEFPLLHIYRGDSLLFRKKLKKTGLEKIWVIYEPLLCFAVTAIVSVFNIFLGLPLFLSAISFWFNEWYQVNNVWGSRDMKIEKMRMIAFFDNLKSQKEEFVTVHG